MTYFVRLPYDLREELCQYLQFELIGNLYANMAEFSVLTNRKRFCQILWRKHFLIDETHTEDVPFYNIVTTYWRLVNKLGNAMSIEELFYIASKHNLTKIISLILSRYTLMISDYDLDRIIFRDRLNMLTVILPYLNDTIKMMLLMKSLTFNRRRLVKYLYKEGVKPNYELLSNTIKVRVKEIAI